MKQTAVDWYEKEINSLFEKYEAKQISRADFLIMKHNIFYPAKEMEKTNTDNKVIHFAEWLTKKHTTVLMTLYEQFEEQYYNETYNTETK